MDSRIRTDVNFDVPDQVFQGYSSKEGFDVPRRMTFFSDSFFSSSSFCNLLCVMGIHCFFSDSM